MIPHQLTSYDILCLSLALQRIAPHRKPIGTKHLPVYQTNLPFAPLRPILYFYFIWSLCVGDARHFRPLPPDQAWGLPSLLYSTHQGCLGDIVRSVRPALFCETSVNIMLDLETQKRTGVRASSRLAHRWFVNGLLVGRTIRNLRHVSTRRPSSPPPGALSLQPNISQLV